MIAIKGMKMPTCCRDCPMCHDAACYARGYRDADNGNGLKRRDDCPLVEVLSEKAQLSEEDVTSDMISRQDAIDACHNYEDGKDAYAYGYIVEERLQALPSAQPEPLTDKEQRIFLAAMGREEKEKSHGNKA